MSDSFTILWRYIPLSVFDPRLMLSHFGGASSWLYNRRLYYEWLSGVIRLFGVEVEWRFPRLLRQRMDYFEGLIDKEFPTAPMPVNS